LRAEYNTDMISVQRDVELSRRAGQLPDICPQDWRERGSGESNRFWPFDMTHQRLKVLLSCLSRLRIGIKI
jgi:hypothetical protein